MNDIPGLPIPGLEKTSPTNDAKILSAVLAMECAKVALPEIPMLSPEDLMAFRAENTAALRAFRRSMLRYASDLNDKICGMAPEEFETITNFFIQTEIVPALDELRSTMNGPARPWYQRAVDMFRVVPALAVAFMTMDKNAAIAQVLTTYAGQRRTIFQRGDCKGGSTRDTEKKWPLLLIATRSLPVGSIVRSAHTVHHCLRTSQVSITKAVNAEAAT